MCTHTHYIACSSPLILLFFDESIAVLILSTMILAAATWVHLENLHECILFSSTLATICLIAPTWKYVYLQHYKVHINGPWDIAHISLDG